MKKFLLIFFTAILIITFSACSINSVSQTEEISEQTDSVIAEIIPVNEIFLKDTSIEIVLSENQEPHGDANDLTWEASEVVSILLNDNSITSSDTSVEVEGTTATITAAGTYSISGTLSNGMIIVNSVEDKPVRLILDGTSIHNESGSAINIIAADKVLLFLDDGTKNKLSDGENYISADSEDEEYNAALFSMADLTISGSGSLIVEGNYKDGIASKDGLLIASGTLSVTAVDDGIRGKDYLVIEDGDITVNSMGDGLKSNNSSDASRGYVLIKNGTLTITAYGDAITAETDVLISKGTFTLTTLIEEGALVDTNTSTKAIKAGVSVVVDDGTFIIDSADDALNSNNAIIINSGSFTIKSGDDGMHADITLTINGGEINITESYEGLESAMVTINEGIISIVAIDDGINLTGDMDSSELAGNMLLDGGPGGGRQAAGGQGMGGNLPPGGELGGSIPGMGENMPIGGDIGTEVIDGSVPSIDEDMTNISDIGLPMDEVAGDFFLYINGGTILLDTGGDGLDSNGSIEMTGGIVLINGPTVDREGPIDYVETFNISGGLLVAAGSSGMSMSPSTSSTQNSIILNFNSVAQAGMLFHIEDEDDNDILTFAPSKYYQSIAVSSPDIQIGTTYQVLMSGSSTGIESGGLYEGGEYSGGTLVTSLTLSSTVTSLGSRAVWH